MGNTLELEGKSDAREQIQLEELEGSFVKGNGDR